MVSKKTKTNQNTSESQNKGRVVRGHANFREVENSRHGDKLLVNKIIKVIQNKRRVGGPIILKDNSSLSMKNKNLDKLRIVRVVGINC